MKTAAALHLISSTRPIKEPARIESESLAIHEARLAAIRNLGTSWLGHHAYRFNPRHSWDPEVYEDARKPFLEDIARRAAADRARNPAFHRADRIRAALAV